MSVNRGEDIGTTATDAEKKLNQAITLSWKLFELSCQGPSRPPKFH